LPSRAEDSQRFPKRCASTIFFYAVHFALQQAMQQLGGFAEYLFFLINNFWIEKV
jgi:hypothetical protein